jgi:hypothetical protein
MVIFFLFFVFALVEIVQKTKGLKFPLHCNLFIIKFEIAAEAVIDVLFDGGEEGTLYILFVVGLRLGFLGVEAQLISNFDLL